MTIIMIKSKEQAEKILKDLMSWKEKLEWFEPPDLIFDIDKNIKNWRTIPLCYRKCDRCNTFYLGSNPAGELFQEGTCYCQECGFAYEKSVGVRIAIQGDKVLYKGW